MADAKIEIKVGGVSFTGEGSESWVSQELDKVLKKVPDLLALVPKDPEPMGGKPAGGHSGAKHKGTLAALLTRTGSRTNQTRRFLATALWLQDGGKNRLSTSEVSKALSDNNQNRLTNPSQCLADNVRSGFCEKDGAKQFFVTDDGRAEIG